MVEERKTKMEASIRQGLRCAKRDFVWSKQNQVIIKIICEMVVEARLGSWGKKNTDPLFLQGYGLQRLPGEPE